MATGDRGPHYSKQEEEVVPPLNVDPAPRLNIFNQRAGAPTNTVTGSGCGHAYEVITPQTAAVVGPGNKIGVDPKFLNPLAGDFHLQAGSPAIDAADTAATETSDFDSTARPQGAGRDMGAFEYKP